MNLLVVNLRFTKSKFYKLHFKKIASLSRLGILSTLEWPISPLFDVFVCLLVQFADR